MTKQILALSLGLLIFSACSATHSWFTKPTTQSVIADGCRAAAADDNMHNALLNQFMGAFPQLAPVQVGINTAHLAIQAALAKCISDASAQVAPLPPSPAQ